MGELAVLFSHANFQRPMGLLSLLDEESTPPEVGKFCRALTVLHTPLPHRESQCTRGWEDGPQHQPTLCHALIQQEGSGRCGQFYACLRKTHH